MDERPMVTPWTLLQHSGSYSEPSKNRARAVLGKGEEKWKKQESTRGERTRGDRKTICNRRWDILRRPKELCSLSGETMWSPFQCISQPQMLPFWSWLSDELYQSPSVNHGCVIGGYISLLGNHLLYGQYLPACICTAFLLKSCEISVMEGRHNSPITSTCSIDSSNYPQQYTTLNFCWPRRGLRWLKLPKNTRKSAALTLSNLS